MSQIDTDPMSTVIVLAFCCATVPALLWAWNMLLYREPQIGSCAETGSCSLPTAISVLIPARNEERVIAASLTSLLASRGVEIEIVVLDDASTDRTAEIVRSFAEKDARVRLRSSPPLPRGWNGKQHACHVLAQAARSDVLCFLDADVCLAPEALVSMSSFLGRSGSDLVSGFPRQETESPLECLLLPLIHFVLLSYLPLAGMRTIPTPGFAAGCGQFLMVRRDAYRKSGGHAEIRTTMHDGLLLPQLFRRNGLRTDIADLTHLATCRMYHNAPEVWRGLAKNATEGMAAPARPRTMRLHARSYSPHWRRRIFLVWFPSGNIGSLFTALCCIHLGLLFCSFFSGTRCYANSLVSGSPGKSGLIAWGDASIGAGGPHHSTPFSGLRAK
jgi:glycosyltransferase involved in cell wall biosynthesis